MKLSFIELEVSDLDAWELYLVDAVGLQKRNNNKYAMDDEREFRIQLIEGPADDLTTLGFEVDEEDDILELVQSLRHGNYNVEMSANPEERGAKKRYCTTDPTGIKVELVEELRKPIQKFQSKVQNCGFVTGDGGFGHCVITSNGNIKKSTEFYQDLLRFRLSDHLMLGGRVDIAFFHINQRHHSVAFSNGPNPRGKHIDHFMLETKGGVDEVGKCLDRMIKHGFKVDQTIGRHTNDRMTSFYAMNPSGFRMEFGFGGLLIDDETWDDTKIWGATSFWGHNNVKSNGHKLGLNWTKIGKDTTKANL